MRPPSATQSRAVAGAPAPRGSPSGRMPREYRARHQMSIIYAHLINIAVCDAGAPSETRFNIRRRALLDYGLVLLPLICLGHNMMNWRHIGPPRDAEETLRHVAQGRNPTGGHCRTLLQR